MPGPLPTDDLKHILSHTASLWEPLRGQRLFITGGTGFFGRWLLESFAHANETLELEAEAVVLTRDKDAFAEKAPHLMSRVYLQFHRGDVRNFSFPPGRFSHVIHAATDASARLNAEDPLLMLETTIAGARRTLDFARQCGASKFLLTSSGAVYGRQPATMTHLPEDYEGAPDVGSPGSAYGEGKRLSELLCAIYSREPLGQACCEIKIARCFAFVGPGLPLDAHFAIGNFIRDAIADNPISIQGDGTPVRSYLYAADLAIWLWTILFAGAALHPYNVGSAAALSISDTAEAVRRVLDRKKPIVAAQKSVPGRTPARYVPDTNRATKELGLREWIGLEDAIRKTAQWHGWQK